jgi:hypothetical protein
MNRLRTTLLPAIWLLLLCGCQWRNNSPAPQVVDPALPMSMSRNELVEYLNQQTAGLTGWRCMDTHVAATIPGSPLTQKLRGSLACQSPGRFRLIADGALMVHADLGTNEEFCWAYVKPGESAVLTWRHEDAHLLQHLPGCPPRLEPRWLMTVLGIEPLRADDYQLGNAPAGSRELWLVAIEQASDGSSLRRVIKVDTVQGVAREHALYDADGQAIVRAMLSRHQSVQGKRLPHEVRLLFPQNETRLTLQFHGIEINTSLSDAMWQPPRARGIEMVDLGTLVRHRLQAEGRGTRPGSPTSPDSEFQPVGSTGHVEARTAGKSGNEFPGLPLHPGSGSGGPTDMIDDLTAIEGPDHYDRGSDIPEFDIPAGTPAPRRRWWPPFGRR